MAAPSSDRDRAVRSLSGLLVICAVAALLSACGMSTPPPASLPVAYTTLADFARPIGSSERLYLPVYDRNQVLTYRLDGTRAKLTITQNLKGPTAVAVGRDGKIYVTNGYGNSVTTYLPDGSETTPTIAVASPSGIAVDKDGKIYVVSDQASESCSPSGTITTYKPDGTQTAPTIVVTGEPMGIALDSNGKIYVASFCGGPGNQGEVTTYKPDGKPTKPTITNRSGIVSPFGLAIDKSGKLYVTDYLGDGTGYVTAYTLAGKEIQPTISEGIAYPTGIAIGAGGKIFVANTGHGSTGGNITTYLPNGQRTKPTIVKGVSFPNLIAIQ
jgi:sugar lactone lactonase YvrE